MEIPDIFGVAVVFRIVHLVSTSERKGTVLAKAVSTRYLISPCFLMRREE